MPRDKEKGSKKKKRQRERERWRSMTPEQRAQAYEDDIAHRPWRPRLPRPWRVRSAAARARDLRSLKGWLHDSLETVKPQRLDGDVVSGALHGSGARERPVIGPAAENLRDHFVHLRMLSGVIWLCVLLVLGSLLVASTSFFVLAGAVGALCMSVVLPILCLRADWALVRLAQGRPVGLLEYVHLRLGGGRRQGR